MPWLEDGSYSVDEDLVDNQVLPENLERLARWLGLSAALPPRVLAALIKLRIQEMTTPS